MTGLPECAVSKDIRLVLAASEDLDRHLRRLRRSRRRCRSCASLKDCPVWREFQSQIDAAILEFARLSELDKTLGREVES